MLKQSLNCRFATTKSRGILWTLIRPVFPVTLSTAGGLSCLGSGSTVEGMRSLEAFGVTVVTLTVFTGCGSSNKTGETTEADAADGPIVCTGFTCSVDFPCAPDQQTTCVANDPKSIYRYETWSCERVCGTPCCSGATCRGQTESCPAGTACAKPTAPTSGTSANAECIDEARTCGGVDNKQCAIGQYCEYPETLCTASSCPSATHVCDGIKAGGLGICTMLPDSSECTTADPVCGCDGVTYKDECTRKAANVALAYKGACS